MKAKWTLLLYVLSLVGPTAHAQKEANKALPAFKVVGYYFLQAALQDSTNTDTAYRFLDQITHLNLAFFNPDPAGQFRHDLPLQALIAKAHRKGVRVLASIGGGGAHPYYTALLQQNQRTAFVASLVSLVQQYRLDGIDVDLEGSDIDTNYAGFVTALAAALKPHGKLLTAAIATAYKEQLPDQALAHYDFVNIMSYDRTGPWRPSDPGPHAPLDMAVQDLAYWHQERGLPKEKLVLGLPFYGYGFGTPGSPVISLTYKEVVALYPGEQSDTLRLPADRVFYYNSRATIEKKTALALQDGGGVMIWQLLGDATGEQSLLNTIHRLIHKK